MAGLKKVVAVTVAAVVLAAFAVYLLRPTTSSNAGNVVINEPTSPTTPGTDTGSGGEPTSPPPSPPPRASGGPKHQVCVPPNDKIPDHARDRGANWYRFGGGGPDAASICGAFPGVRARTNAGL